MIDPVWRASVLLVLAAVANAFAGGSGLNVVAVANEASTNSLQLANYYCEKRGVPPQNLLRINWPGNAVTWSHTDFENTLRAPLNAMLTARQLSNQIEYVLLSMDIPYRVTNSAGSVNNNVNGTTSTLHYGFKNNALDPFFFCTLAVGSESDYAGSEGIFRQTPPISASSNSWLTMMLTSSNLAQAMAIVDRGVASDYSFPTQTVFLAEGTDPLRWGRMYLYDDARLEVLLRGQPPIVRTNADSPNGLGLAMGYQGGNQTVNLSSATFAPGAMADNLTSFSGYLFENSLHTDALDFLNAGATASYGTVVEPCAYFAKFASPRNHYYQARGFSIAECYYLSVTNPYQGVLVGEPLAAPFALPGNATWQTPADAVLSGTTNLSVVLQSPEAGRPIQQADLFVDGVLAHSVTNIAPRQGNIVYVTINGFQTNYPVPTSATLASIVNNLTARLNRNTYSNSTKVRALARGDRIELQSLDLTRPGANTTLSVSNYIGSASVLTTHIRAARTNFLDQVARGLHGYVVTNSAVTLSVGQFLRCVVLKTNGSVVTVAVTNQTAGATLNDFAKLFFAGINTNASLVTPDGLVVENVHMHEDEPYRTFVYGPNDHSGEFNVRARTPGWPEAQMRVAFSGSAPFTILDAGTNRLDENLTDLYPRNHLYLTAGVTNLALTFPFNTTTNADGFHELTVVAYEGSHVRTQTRAKLPVRIQNTPLTATFETLFGGTNTDLSATLQFRVMANTNSASVNRIELFSTGGRWGVVSNLATAIFSLATTNLQIGLHPICAIVTRADGRQYRTETHWLRILGPEPPFALTVIDPTPTLAWPATVGRRYEILSTTNVTGSFTLHDAVTPSNSPALWSETNNSNPRRFYRVRPQP